MAKLPSIQFYPGDWRKDIGVQSLSFHDRGIWFEILMLMHESERRGLLVLNGNPMPDDALARILGLDKQNLTTTLSTLLSSGVASREPDTGALMCRRMVRDEILRKIRQESGKLGGNPILVNQNPTTRVKQNPTPSSSSSISTTEPMTPSMIAQAVKVELGLGGSRNLMILEEVCKAELSKGTSPDELRDSLIEAFRLYEKSKPKLEWSTGAEKFFADGLWRNFDGWPWRKGEFPVATVRPITAIEKMQRQRAGQ